MDKEQNGGRCALGLRFSFRCVSDGAGSNDPAGMLLPRWLMAYVRRFPRWTTITVKVCPDTLQVAALNKSKANLSRRLAHDEVRDANLERAIKRRPSKC